MMFMAFGMHELETRFSKMTCTMEVDKGSEVPVYSIRVWCWNTVLSIPIAYCYCYCSHYRHPPWSTNGTFHATAPLAQGLYKGRHVSCRKRSSPARRI
jgi:hypothetical protein